MQGATRLSTLDAPEPAPFGGGSRGSTSRWKK